MKKVVVTRRSNDFHACPEGQPEIWESGQTALEAVGKLVAHNELFFNIEVGLPAGERHPEFDCPLSPRPQ